MSKITVIKNFPVVQTGAEIITDSLTLYGGSLMITCSSNSLAPALFDLPLNPNTSHLHIQMYL